MSDAPAAYRIVSRLHVNQWSNQLQQAIPGWDIRALWISTGTILPVFVPDASYTAENVDAMIRSAGATDEQMHALGG
jgi:hypothetical protein